VEYNGVPYSSVDDDRRYRAWVGVPPTVAEYIFRKYYSPWGLLDRTCLLVVLHFLKVMPTEDNASVMFKFRSRNTYREKLWSTLEYLDGIMSEVSFSSRLFDFIPFKGIFKDIALIVDGTDCPINRLSSRLKRLAYSSGRKKDNTQSKYNLKYIIAVQVATGKICAVLGPHPSSVVDITALQDTGLIGYLEFWHPFEILLADKGYQGEAKCLTPYKDN